MYLEGYYNCSVTQDPNFKPFKILNCKKIDIDADALLMLKGSLSSTRTQLDLLEQLTSTSSAVDGM